MSVQRPAASVPAPWSDAARTRVRRLARAHAPTTIAVGLAAAAASGFGLASVYRHDHFGSNAYDLGIFDQTIWGYSRLEMIPNTVLRVHNQLGDHFEPILMSLAPLYWLRDDVRMILIAQAILTAAASLPLFLYARRVLGSAAALAFQVAYLLFWAVLGGNIYDFHEIAFAAPILSLAIYATLTRRTWLLWAMVALALLTQEDLAFLLVGLGIFIAVAQRRWRLGAAVAGVSVAAFALLVYAVIPAFAERTYSHWRYYRSLGDTPGEALRHLVTHPIGSVKLFFTPEDKRIALFNLFAPWLALPLVSPLLIVLLPALATRFFSDKPSHWAPLGFHYSLVLAPLLAFAAVDTLARANRLAQPRVGRPLVAVVSAGLLAAGIYFTFARLRPLDELDRYAPAAELAQIRSCLAVIPSGASVAATSALVPHLSHRRTIYLLRRRVPEVEYVAVNTATWTLPLTAGEVRRLLASKLRSGYGVVCAGRRTAVLARGAPGRRLPPRLRTS